MEKTLSFAFDEKWNFVVPGELETTIAFAVDHFLKLAQKAIQDHGCFSVALSGGFTPQLLYQSLIEPANLEKVNWKKVFLFWSDERSVPPDHPDSNYYRAMKILAKLPIPKNQIFRMKAEKNIEKGAHLYEKLIESKIASKKFDLVMLGLGEDGHIASLFPKTHALHSQEQLVVANFIPKLGCWRMSLTFKCINEAFNPVIYVFGKNKAEIVQKVCSSPYDPDIYPVQRVGTETSKALWILDNLAFSRVKESDLKK